MESNEGSITEKIQDVDNESISWFGNNLRSPGSYVDSHAQSRAVSSFEIDEISSIGATSWRLGMPWFRYGGRVTTPTSLHRSSFNFGGGAHHNQQDDSRYYGGLMKTDGGDDGPGSDVGLAGQQHHALKHTRNAINSSRIQDHSNDELHLPKHYLPPQPNALSKANSLIKSLSFRSKSNSDRIDDFTDAEWTPQDSAYGAACPVCGCIPKSMRRSIEFTLILAMIIGFVYLVVTTSIHITNDRSNASKQNSTTTSDYRGGQIALDDDLYVEYEKTTDDATYYSQNFDDDGNANAYAYNNDDNNYVNGDDTVAGDDAYNRRL